MTKVSTQIGMRARGKAFPTLPGDLAWTAAIAAIWMALSIVVGLAARSAHPPVVDSGLPTECFNMERSTGPLRRSYARLVLRDSKGSPRSESNVQCEEDADRFLTK